MASTDKVLSTIGALNTLIENFPMNILDLFKTKTYTSVFEFIIDVLYALGVNVDEIISYLINEIFSIMPNIEEGLEAFQTKLTNKDFTNIEQSEFLEKLEEGLKKLTIDDVKKEKSHNNCYYFICSYIYSSWVLYPGRQTQTSRL